MGIGYKPRELKVIDLTDHAARQAALAKELVAAATDIGFFYVTGHGISQAEVDGQFATAKRFLDLPKEKRVNVLTDKKNMSYILGWSEEKLQKGGTMRSGMLTAYDKGRMRDLWPSEEVCPGFKKETLEFMLKCHRVTKVIMGCLAIGLGLPEDHFYKEMDPEYEDIATALYMNHYPSVEEREILPGVLRIWAHTDFEILTLLFQKIGQPGLEVLPGKEAADGKAAAEGMWSPVDPLEGAITVNIGDALQYWTDDVLQSTYHRVRVPRADEYKGDRYSLAYFANCRNSTLLQGPAKRHPPITFPDILRSKAAAPLKRSEEMSDEETAKMHSSLAQGPGFILEGKEQTAIAA